MFWDHSQSQYILDEIHRQQNNNNRQRVNSHGSTNNNNARSTFTLPHLNANRSGPSSPSNQSNQQNLASRSGWTEQVRPRSFVAEQNLPRQCEICGYAHSTERSNFDKCGKGGGGEKGGGDADRGNEGGGSGGDGDRPPGGGKRRGSQGGGTGGGRGTGAGGGGGGDGDDDNDMNGNDPRVCPDELTTFLFLAVGLAVLGFVYLAIACKGSDDFSSCMGMGQSSCPIGDNMKEFFKKAGVSGGGKGGSSLDPLLQDQYSAFKRAMKNSGCRRNDPRENCKGLANYAATMAGATILGTGKTLPFRNPILCRCKDKNPKSKFCLPKDGSCKNCVCESIEVETILKEEGDLRPGYCWSFAGAGEVDIGLFYPLVVVGFTIRHPSPSLLPPGFFSSAPKDFEVWGIEKSTNFSFGQFQYTENGGSTQIFEVKNFTATKFSQVKFNFSSNHGNPNYTAVYKVEVHGLLEPQ